MASRFLNLLATIPKQKGTCYSAGKYVPNRKHITSKKSSRSCERYNCKSDLSSSGYHVRSYSQPATARRPTFQYESRRNYRDEHDEDMEEAEGRSYGREEVTDDSPFYYESPEKDIRRFESAREVSPIKSRLREINEIAREKEIETETIQYELEATRPREPNMVYDIFGHFSTLYNSRNEKLLPHLQPSNLRPFGSTNSLIMPTQIKSANIIKYPVVDTHDAHSVNKSTRSGERESDDMQRREFSTFKNLSSVHRKENPGYRPGNKMSKFIKSKEKELKDSDMQYDFDDASEMSTELKTCNDIIEKHRNLNAKYYQQKHNTKKMTSERKAIESTSADKGRFKRVSPSTAASTPNIETRRKYDFASEKKTKTTETKSTITKDSSKPQPQREESLPWPDPEVQIPSMIRSTLPINILQTTAKPEDSELLEKIVLGPNQRLGAPWPSYSERITPKKSKGISIVYPALSANESMKTPTKSEPLHVRDVQKRGISTESKFRLDGGLFSNDCRLRHVLCKKEVVDSICQKSNAFKDSLCSRKNSSALNYFPTARYSSRSDHCEDKKKKKKKKCICHVSIRKKPPKRKRLPKFIPKDCPCLDMGALKEGNPLPRLKPKRVREPKKICPRPEDECLLQERADDGLKIKPKELPIIVPKECPCVDSVIKDAPKLKRLPWREIKEPKRVCEGECEGKDCCPPRADKNLKIKRKTLPYLEPSDCPCREPVPMKNIPLIRLPKKDVKPPPRKCKKLKCPDNPLRSDRGMIIEMKDLPKYVPKDCPCREPPPPTKAPKLPRLKKVYIKPRKCIPEQEEEKCPPRSDEADWEYVYNECCYVEEGEKRYTRDTKKKKKSKGTEKRSKSRRTSVRRFSTHTKHMTNIENGQGTERKNDDQISLREGETVNEEKEIAGHTESSDPSKNIVTKYSSSPFKFDVPWAITGTRKFSTSMNRINYVRNEEPECFMRRPISTNKIISAEAALEGKETSQKISCDNRSKSKKGVKCPKFNLPECPPKARTSCLDKRKRFEKACTKTETPYPSFSECSEVDVAEVLSEELQPSKPIIKQLESFTVPPPHQGHIDPMKEDMCLRKKFGLAPRCGSATCSLDMSSKFLKQKDFLDQMNKTDECEVDECDKKIKTVMDQCCKNNKTEKVAKGGKCLKKTNDRCCIGSGNKSSLRKIDEEEKCIEECRRKIRERERLKNMTLWERIVNYFRARPDCPPPEEFKRRILREKAERAAARAGLCVYDPKEMCSEMNELPKIITAKDCVKESTEDTDCPPEKTEQDCKIEDDEDEKTTVDAGKCRRFKFSCTKSDKDKKNAAEFPKDNCEKKVSEDKNECKDECDDEKETEVSESLCQKLKQCLCGSQKRTYSTWRGGTLEHYILDEASNQYKRKCDINMSDLDKKIDNLVTQGYVNISDPYSCLFRELRDSSRGCLKYLENNDIESELQDLLNNKQTVTTFRCGFLNDQKPSSQSLNEYQQLDRTTRAVGKVKDQQVECLSKDCLRREDANGLKDDSQAEKHGKTKNMVGEPDELEELGSIPSRDR